MSTHGDVERERVSERLEELYRRHLPLEDSEVSGYYPPDLAESERDRFGICLATTDGEVFCAGDHDRPFALQSISKVFVYGMALEDRGRDHVLERVGVEPSGDPFYSITFDEPRSSSNAYSKPCSATPGTGIWRWTRTRSPRR